MTFNVVLNPLQEARAPLALPVHHVFTSGAYVQLRRPQSGGIWMIVPPQSQQKMSHKRPAATSLSGCRVMRMFS